MKTADSAPLAVRSSAFQGLIGIARGDITPPVGIYARNWGAAKHDVAETIHRPLTVNALVIKSLDNGPAQVLIDADMGWWRTPELFEAFRSRLFEEFSLQPGQLIFALTHTHAGPALMISDQDLPGMDLTRAWIDQTLETVIRTVRRAFSDCEESILDWNVGRCSLASNRDLPDPDNVPNKFLCGYNPDNSADDTLLVGRVSNMSGQLRATLVNYACHPTTLAADNKAISPDYIGAMRETMEASTGAPALFLLGSCGELAPRVQYVGDCEVADAHGRELGFAALSALSAMDPAGTEFSFQQELASGAPLAIWNHQPCSIPKTLSCRQLQVELPLKDWPSADELERQRQECTDRVLAERLLRRRDVRKRLGDGRTFSLPLYIWRMGDAVLVGSCCEAYSILQQTLRRRFPDHTIVCMNLINGTIGYLAPAELYDVDIYPVWQTPFDRGALETMIDTLVEAIDDILHT